MVHFTVRSSLFSSLVVVVFFLFDASSYASEVVEVDAICKEARYPSFCSDVLNSKPGGAKGADLVTLAQYAIDVANANITNTWNLIQSLAENATDPSAKVHYSMCWMRFSINDNGASAHIRDAEDRLKAGDYKGLLGAAAAIRNDVDRCLSGMLPYDPPYEDPSQLPQYGYVLIEVVEIIIAISDILRQH